MKKEKIKQLEWPPYSPDISPIENIFHMLKNEVYDGPQFLKKDALWSRIQDNNSKLFTRELHDE